MGALRILPAKIIAFQLYTYQVTLQSLFGFTQALSFELAEFFSGEYGAFREGVIGEASCAFDHVAECFAIANSVLAGVADFAIQFNGFGLRKFRYGFDQQAVPAF